MTNNLKAERTLTAERLTPDQIDKAWELIDRLENFQSYRGEELDDGDYTDISVAIYFLRNLLPSQSLSTQQPMGEVTDEMVTKGADALQKMYHGGEDEPFHLMAKAVLTAALHPNQESGE